MNEELIIQTLSGGEYEIKIYKQEFETGDNYGYVIERVESPSMKEQILMGDGYDSEDDIIEELSNLSTALQAIFGWKVKGRKMNSITYNVYSIEYDVNLGTSNKKFLEKALVEKENEVLFLIEKGYLSPEDIAYVETVQTKIGINIISPESVLLFTLEYWLTNT